MAAVDAADGAGAATLKRCAVLESSCPMLRSSPLARVPVPPCESARDSLPGVLAVQPTIVEKGTTVVGVGPIVGARALSSTEPALDVKRTPRSGVFLRRTPSAA
jgi:hypothetical protein